MSAVEDAVVTLSLARRAERFPDRTAIVDVSENRLHAPAETVREDRVTYAELSRIAGRLAGALEQRGVGSGDTVCLVTRNRVASLALVFACRRLGATLAPISHRLTPATVTRPFEVLEPAIVVAEAAQRDLMRSIPHDRTVTLEELAGTDASAVDAGTERDIDAPLLAIHDESGESVATLSPETVEWNCIDAVLEWGLSREDSGFVLDPLSTADGLFRTALPVLYVGGQLLLDRAFDPSDTLTAIDDGDVAVVSGRRAPIRELAAHENADALADLECAICDHAVDEAPVETLLEYGVTVSRAYGAPACPTAATRTVAGPTDDDAIGRPVLDCEAQLVDDGGTVLEGEATGQLRLSGPVVADGYATPADDRDGSEAASKSAPRLADDWFDTGEQFRRIDDGSYRRP
ncbi:AMP-dependent synthetase and ligase [Natronococcus amylolyticus DSM 10524]|uniref:AMP-dependent synthetase and ligase n=1 Tax=Natronococcus amylolyticus DSM 10524 TaxID=1227497 RepID=L9XFT5_9EURY|nr:AMP-binding protein [Natronococcus amylolyticus]ELY59523.1 AMP-dependent synthetase and ligase [Natronococcus amylolyticus DSM 10524]